MTWSEKFDSATEPTTEDIAQFVGNSLYGRLCEHIESSYKVKKLSEYSRCSGQPGWNVKYKKSGKTLCTLYPMSGYFIALVVIGNKETPETELVLPTFSKYIQEMYASTNFLLGGRWLMIEVKDEAVYRECLTLVDIRARSK